MGFQTPRGTYDILSSDVYKWQQLEEKLRQVCQLYGYEELRTPIFEDTKVFKRENDSSDMVNKEMYTFVMNHDSYTLRPEGTAGVIRSFVQNKQYASADLPAKIFYMGEMFRHERPQKGRQRQFNQFGVENIGIKSPYIDAETIALGYGIVKDMGISHVKVLINTLGDDESRAAYREALKEHFREGIAELCPDCARRYEQNPLRILDCKVDHDHPLVKSAPALSDYLNEESKTYFAEVLKTLEVLGIPYEIDQRLVRGLDYYTHTVFEVVSTHEEAGSQATIFAGGRYDHLVEYFGGPQMSGIGFAIGMERLIMMAEAEGYAFAPKPPVDVYVMSLGEVGSYPLEIATMCRKAGYSAEVNMAPRSMKAQFKSVDRMQAANVVIIGEDEMKQGVVTLKHIATQEQVSIKKEELIEQLERFGK